MIDKLGCDPVGLQVALDQGGVVLVDLLRFRSLGREAWECRNGWDQHPQKSHGEARIA
jgi:hypothetical protein